MASILFPREYLGSNPLRHRSWRYKNRNAGARQIGKGIAAPKDCDTCERLPRHRKGHSGPGVRRRKVARGARQRRHCDTWRGVAIDGAHQERQFHFSQRKTIGSGSAIGPATRSSDRERRQLLCPIRSHRWRGGRGAHGIRGHSRHRRRRRHRHRRQNADRRQRHCRRVGAQSPAVS